MPFELIGMNHPAHELSTDAYRKLSPFEQIPAIDDDGIVLSESAAILSTSQRSRGVEIPYFSLVAKHVHEESEWRQLLQPDSELNRAARSLREGARPRQREPCPDTSAASFGIEQ